MTVADFRIGTEFTLSGRRYRCTDAGTRVVVAICLEPHRVTVTGVTGGGRSEVTADPSWHRGPPYAVVEHVIDETCLGGCEPL